MSDRGFPRPVQVADLSPAEEATITAICPGLGQTVDAAGRRDDVLWGPYLTVATGWASDPDTRHSGSSGGALTALALHLVEDGVVDAVLTIRADADRPMGNSTTILTTRADLLEAAGSRYAPSSPLSLVPLAVSSGRRHAFVGKPCDAAALRAWSERDARVAAAFPVILSFFCAGVPSTRGGERLLEAMGADARALKQFRYRGNGWPGRATATLADGSERSMSYHDSWGGVLSKHVQHRCKICADGTGTAADIVCADAWEADEAGYPLFDEKDGISLILARTEKGARLVSDAAAKGRVVLTPFDIAGLDRIQPGQRDRRRAVLARLAALWLIGRPVPRYRGLGLVAAARQSSVVRLVKNFVGMLRRALRRA
jgi:coenzyme F420 hydrogenase subunit beta